MSQSTRVPRGNIKFHRCTLPVFYPYIIQEEEKGLSEEIPRIYDVARYLFNKRLEITNIYTHTLSNVMSMRINRFMRRGTEKARDVHYEHYRFAIARC